MWKCPTLKNENLRPAGLAPRMGCGHWNRMSTRHPRSRIEHGIYQTSACEKCGKRTRDNGSMYYFDNMLDALLFMEQKRAEEEEE